MSKKKHNEPMYIFYNKDNGRILGNYSKYDAEKDCYVKCDPKEVIKVAAGASPELSSSSFKVLEVMLEEGSELKDLKVDPKKRKLVARKPEKAPV
jgi:hypothetical protein